MDALERLLRRLAAGARDLATRRGWRGRFILAFVAIQLAAPLHYYTVRSDPHDERFAWRMFSPTRMLTCDPRFTVDDEPVALTRAFHEAWIEIARRGRLVVLEAMGAELCRRHPGSEVRLDLRCRAVDGTPSSYGGADLCEFPEL